MKEQIIFSLDEINDEDYYHEVSPGLYAKTRMNRLTGEVMLVHGFAAVCRAVLERLGVEYEMVDFGEQMPVNVVIKADSYIPIQFKGMSALYCRQEVR